MIWATLGKAILGRTLPVGSLVKGRLEIKTDWAGAHCNIVFAAMLGFKASIGCECAEIKQDGFMLFCDGKFCEQHCPRAAWVVGILFIKLNGTGGHCNWLVAAREGFRSSVGYECTAKELSELEGF